MRGQTISPASEKSHENTWDVKQSTKVLARGQSSISDRRGASPEQRTSWALHAVVLVAQVTKHSTHHSHLSDLIIASVKTDANAEHTLATSTQLRPTVRLPETTVSPCSVTIATPAVRTSRAIHLPASTCLPKHTTDMTAVAGIAVCFAT
mmetsp:Transcript_145718/g.466923  ORF Transcript_145718/g.466923 Transcript_145718/m.466923 type:complete len:150 (-) Transcript_145718:371-820(-)